MKRALCVGINRYPNKDLWLKGCVNDATSWAEMLVDHFGLAASQVTTLLDEQATKAAILDRLDGLIDASKRGDVLVFTNSSHGTYVADTSGDEPTYDEAMCPYDMDRHLIVDDELRQRLARLAPGVRATVISDSCFSGSVTRALPDDEAPRARFVNPSELGRPEIAGVRRFRPHGVAQRAMGEVLLSGCRDDQFSWDARINGTFRGAMSFYAQEIIREAGYRITNRDLRAKLVPRLAAAHFDQEPQLEGRSGYKRRRVFR